MAYRRHRGGIMGGAGIFGGYASTGERLVLPVPGPYQHFFEHEPSAKKVAAGKKAAAKSNWLPFLKSAIEYDWDLRPEAERRVHGAYSRWLAGVSADYASQLSPQERQKYEESKRKRIEAGPSRRQRRAEGINGALFIPPNKPLFVLPPKRKRMGQARRSAGPPPVHSRAPRGHFQTPVYFPEEEMKHSPEDYEDL